jgi:hypothetical protein
MRLKNLLCWTFIFAAILLVINPVFADDTKWLAVGMLHDWFSSAGYEQEVGRRHLVADQQDGLQWPALFEYQDCKAAKALWIGTANYNDPIAGKTYGYKVVHVGPRVLNEVSEWMPAKFKLYGRHDKSTVYVDGTPGGKLDLLDFVDEIDPTLTADRYLYTEANTQIGITEKRKIYSFAQQYHDNYFIQEYTFVNTGIIDNKGTVVNQTLNGVVFFFQHRYSVSKEACVYGLSILPQSAAWGHSEMNDTMWVSDQNGIEKYLSLFSWKGQHSKAGFDCIGAPDNRENGDGHITAPHYAGFAILHADRSAQDHSHDSQQPTTTQYMGSDVNITSGNDPYNEPKMALEYAAMTAGHPAKSHADGVFASGQAADEYLGSVGGFTQCAGFGPYALAPGDSVRIVLAEAIAGLGRQACYTVGAKWFKEVQPYDLPNGTITTDKNEYKNKWVYTGRDSLTQTFKRAAACFKANYKIPVPPPAPSRLEVAGGGDRIQLKWTDNAESWPGFAGYKVYRSIHTPDTLFNEIFACGKGTDHPQVVNSFDDITATRGFDYYYYVVSFDDGKSNVTNANPPGPLHSGIFYAKTVNPTNLKRQAGETLDDVVDANGNIIKTGIRIVPNPYSIRSRDLQFGDSGPDRIMFYNIPGICTIKIFTERGDLIETIEHTNGSGDEAWNSITSSAQTIVSGIYIVVFEMPDGQRAVRKFVVIR